MSTILDIDALRKNARELSATKAKSTIREWRKIYGKQIENDVNAILNYTNKCPACGQNTKG